MLMDSAKRRGRKKRLASQKQPHQVSLQAPKKKKKRSKFGFVYAHWDYISHTYKTGCTEQKENETTQQVVNRLEVRNGANNPIRSHSISVFLLIHSNDCRRLEQSFHNWKNTSAHLAEHALLHRTGVESEVYEPQDRKYDGSVYAKEMIEHFQTAGHTNLIEEDRLNEIFSRMKQKNRLEKCLEFIMDRHGATPDDIRTSLDSMNKK